VLAWVVSGWSKKTVAVFGASTAGHTRAADGIFSAEAAPSRKPGVLPKQRASDQLDGFSARDRACNAFRACNHS